MHKIVESIEIKAPVERVFAFLKDIEARLRLNPFWQVLRVERITVGEIGAGSKFHIIIKSADRKVDYTSEWIDFEENKKIVSRDTSGRIKLTLSVEKTQEGTLLTHAEEFDIPLQALYPEEAVEEELHSWRKAIRFLLSLAKTSFHAFDHTQRLEEIKETLRNNLRVWLGRIKERLESSVRVSDQA